MSFGSITTPRRIGIRQSLCPSQLPVANHVVVTVRLNERDATALESIARQLDVDPITLIYRWIKEKLQATAP
jgi:hypothetical protein